MIQFNLCITNAIKYYKCHDSPDWMKKQKSDNKSKNEDDNCFQYAATVALNYKEIELHSERVSKIIKPFINKYNWKGINFLSKPDGWKKV